jgi:hypothetical protein
MEAENELAHGDIENNAADGKYVHEEPENSEPANMIRSEQGLHDISLGPDNKTPTAAAETQSIAGDNNGDATVESKVDGGAGEAEAVVKIDPPPTLEPVPEEVKRDPNLVSITLRPVDRDWVMGEDWVVDFHNLTTVVGIREYIEKVRGISRHRIQLRLKGKVLPKNREIWTLRRLGIYDGYTMLVEPTLSGSWLWEPKQYYIDKLIREVTEIIEATATAITPGRIELSALNAKIAPPPCIKSSLRVFLRQYPERFYIHTDTTDNVLWIHIPRRPFQMPTFSNFSVEIGSFQYFKPKRFDWAANMDIDDMYKIETLPGMVSRMA